MGEPIVAHPFNCPECGGQLNVYNPDDTQSVACRHCGSLLDLTTQDGKLLALFRQKTHGKTLPLIPLGTLGKLRGEEVIAIGFLVRKTVIEGASYYWSEYLLYNKDHGYRWLTEYDGHWNYIRNVEDMPRDIPGGYEVEHRAIKYEHFQTAIATVDHVLGEFYWKVEAGEKATCSDYISPPLILSGEKTKKEMTWSLGIYLEPEEVWAAFKLPQPVNSKRGIFANQPNPHAAHITRGRMLALGFSAAAIFLYFVFSALARNERVYSNRFTYDSSEGEKSRLTEPFSLLGHTSNARIRMTTNLNNAWAFFGMALINTASDEAVDFGKEISYYHGHDSDGYWSEGRSNGSVFLPSVPPGEYYLRIEPEAQVARFNYEIAVERDVPRFSYLLWLLVLLLLPWGFAEFRRYTFEVSRWAESDHPWINTEEDDE